MAAPQNHPNTCSTQPTAQPVLAGVHPAPSREAVQPQHVPLHTKSLLIQLQSSITGEINVGGNKGQTQRSKTGVASRRYMLTASCLAPWGFRRAVIYHDVYHLFHVLQ